MALVKVKPTSPGRRALVKVVNPDLHKGKPHAPLLERDGNPRRPGIERVLKELLDHARRAFDHLASGDPIHDRHRQGVDAAHGSAIGPPWRRRHGQGHES